MMIVQEDLKYLPVSSNIIFNLLILKTITLKYFPIYFYLLHEPFLGMKASEMPYFVSCSKIKTDLSDYIDKLIFAEFVHSCSHKVWLPYFPKSPSIRVKIFHHLGKAYEKRK